MDTLKLVRKKAQMTSLGTPGVLTLPSGRSFYTMERPWLNNEPSKSCIPVGEYIVRQWDSKKFPISYILEGETVGMYPSDGKARSAILMHPGNTMLDLRGCIALGIAQSTLKEDGVVYPAVLSSQIAMKKFRELQGTEQFKLIISEA